MAVWISVRFPDLLEMKADLRTLCLYRLIVTLKNDQLIDRWLFCRLTVITLGK
jgi:hypothetical protein